MQGEEWCNLVKRYQGAVWAYNEAVDHLHAAPGAALLSGWESAEKARNMAALARAALLGYESIPKTDHELEVATFFEAEEWVLGDQGQSGG